MEIDAVISWVDGYDPIYRQRLQAFCEAQGIRQDKVIEPTRYQQCNEIYYCLMGLKYFAPWIRTIYILTNSQTPQVVTELRQSEFGHKIKIIDQNDLLKKFNISTPVFNSLSVEWLIWHIEGLSNQFLYLNDDFFIIRPVSYRDFFQRDCLVLRGAWKTQSQFKIQNRMKKWLNQSVTLDSHRAWQEKSAQAAGFKRQFYLLEHAPFALNKTTALTYMHEHAWLENLHYPFRHQNHLSSIPLMTHLEAQAQKVIYDHRLKTVMVNPAHHSQQKIKARLHQAQANSRVAFVCMQSLDQATDDLRQYLLAWLDKQIERSQHAAHH